MTQKDLSDLVSKHGNVISCKLETNPADGSSRCYGFAQFEKAEAANACIAALNGKAVEGQTLVVNKL